MMNIEYLSDGQDFNAQDHRTVPVDLFPANEKDLNINWAKITYNKGYLFSDSITGSCGKSVIFLHLVGFHFLDKIYIKQYNWITLQYMYFILTSPPPKKIYTLFQCYIYVYFTSKKYKRFGFKNRNYFIKLHIIQSRKFH